MNGIGLDSESSSNSLQSAVVPHPFQLEKLPVYGSQLGLQFHTLHRVTYFFSRAEWLPCLVSGVPWGSQFGNHCLVMDWELNLGLGDPGSNPHLALKIHGWPWASHYRSVSPMSQDCSEGKRREGTMFITLSSLEAGKCGRKLINKNIFLNCSCNHFIYVWLYWSIQEVLAIWKSCSEESIADIVAG